MHVPFHWLLLALPPLKFDFLFHFQNPTLSVGNGSSNSGSSSHHGKYIRLSPKPLSHSGSVTAAQSTGGAFAAGSKTNTSSSAHSGLMGQLNSPTTTNNTKSPIRRPRGDAKKCRKVYGMDHRELWCTQCKWKKACTRFGESTN